jgi:predicted Zn-dependent protease
MGEMRRSIPFRAAALIVVLQACCIAETSQDAVVARASALFHAGRLKQAEALLRTASAANPNSPALHGALGEMLLKEHNYEESVGEVGIAAQQEPDSREFNLTLSEALIGWKHYGVAMEFLNAVRPKFGKDPQFHYDLGLAYYNTNKLNEAQGEFQEAIRSAPNFERAEFLLAACAASTGDPTKAVEMMHRLTKEHPKNGIYWSTLGQILGSLGGENNAEAVSAVRRSLALSPQDAHAQFVAAVVFVQTGDFASARPLLEHLERLNSKVLAVHVQLARVYSRLGERELARKETNIANDLQKQNAAENRPPGSGEQVGGAEQPWFA